MRVQVYNVLKENLVIIKASFLYYSMLGGTVGESAWSMPLNNFTSFVHECKIIEQVGGRGRQAAFNALANRSCDGQESRTESSQELRLEEDERDHLSFPGQHFPQPGVSA